MRIAAGTSLAFVAALALGACSQDNAPSDAIKNAADTVVKQVDGSQAVKLAQGKYAPQDECKNKPGAEDFRTQLAAAVKAKDAAKLAALAAPDVKLDFGGGSGAAELRKRLAGNQNLWDELTELMALGCGVMMLMLAWRVYRDREGQVAVSAARKLFAFSLLYVFLLFAALLADHALTVVGWLR